MVYGDGLENRWMSKSRGFESYLLRKQVELQFDKFLTQYYKHFVVAATGDVKRASSRWYNTLS